MKKMGINRKILAVGSLAFLLCVGLGVEASAKGGAHRGADSEMRDVVDVVNLVRSTVTIGDQTFVVSESSRLFDAKGRRIRLTELRGSQASGEGDMVEYSVRRSAKGAPAEIRRLSVVEGDFE
jgi:hypothetical protein